jgi:hypothetical protein
MTREQAEHMRAALVGDYVTEHDVAVGACLQAADELSALSRALAHGDDAGTTTSTLAGIEARLRAAAKLAGAIELAADQPDEAASEVHQ